MGSHQTHPESQADAVLGENPTPPQGGGFRPTQEAGCVPSISRLTAHWRFELIISFVAALHPNNVSAPGGRRAPVNRGPPDYERHQTVPSIVQRDGGWSGGSGHPAHERHLDGPEKVEVPAAAKIGIRSQPEIFEKGDGGGGRLQLFYSRKSFFLGDSFVLGLFPRPVTFFMVSNLFLDSDVFFFASPPGREGAPETPKKSISLGKNNQLL